MAISPSSFAAAGRSVETIIKPDIVSEIGSLVLSVVARIDASRRMLSPSFPFAYVDLTAGPGIHEDGVAGAAAVIYELLNVQRFPSMMLLIERRLDYCASLLDSLRPTGNVSVAVRRGESADVAPAEIAHWQRDPFGLVCFDPNGFGSVEEDLLRRVGSLDRLRRMDWLMHLPARAIKRVRRCDDTICKLDLQDILALIHKRRFLVKQSPARTAQDWLYLFGTNAPENTIKEWKRKGWHDWQSIDGRRIIRNNNYTRDELEIIEQANLWEGVGDDNAA